MSRLLAFLAVVTLSCVGFAQADQGSDFARGGAHFSAKEMDIDKDGMISKGEFMRYHMDIWDRMTKSSNGAMSSSDAAASFARGGMHVNVEAMDADHDGTIAKDEFMEYEAPHWNLLPKDPSGQISVADMEKAMSAHRGKAAAAIAGAADAPKSN